MLAIATPSAGDRDRRVAVVFWEGYLGVAPSLINGIRRFTELGFGVDVITRARDDDFAPPPDFGPKVRVMTATAHSSWRFGPVGQLEFLLSRLAFLLFAFRVAGRTPYELVVGVDMNGLLVAVPLSKWKRSRLVHWSLEIHPLPMGKGVVPRAARRLRLRAYRSADVTVAQDDHRSAALVDLGAAERDRIVQIPNGPMGPAFRESSTLLQDRLGLSDGRKIVIHIGMLSETVMSRRLAAEAAGWGDDWMLVFHERQRRDPQDPYLQEVQRAGAGRVVLSLEPVDYDELDDLVASARVGVILYDAAIGLTYSMPGSSGKLGQYLKCGVPVVALDLPGLPEVIERFECGVCVSSVDEVGKAIDRIDQDWSRYRANAFRCYEEVFEFSRQFDKLFAMPHQPSGGQPNP